MFFKTFCVLVLWKKVASALEGLKFVFCVLLGIYFCLMFTNFSGGTGKDFPS